MHAKTWFHGSPEILSTIRAGSSITPTENVARGFSYKPQFLEVNNEGASIRHSGTQGGYLYVVDEVLNASEIKLHSASQDDPWFEWIVLRPVRVRLLRMTEIVASEQMTADEIDAHRRRLVKNDGRSSFDKR